ncbi:MAG: peptidoglycan-associated lipoprotein Pal [bacterium]|nr:peptidoglycan-associated lipoprotein Pal [bacterium]
MIRGRKSTLIIVLMALVFALSLVNCAKKPAQPGPTAQVMEPAAQPVEQPKVEEYTPPPVEQPKPEPAKVVPPPPPVPAFNVSDLVDVFYAFDKSELTSQSRDTLAADAKLLKNAANVKIVIEGHCDERGTNEYNLGLGERRANAAKDYLVSLGISASRIKTISYGEEKPFASGHNEDAWKQNRRAHFGLQ